MGHGGFDTASYVQDVYNATVSEFGTPNYWMRYFNPCQNGSLNQSSSNANSECRAAWDSGGNYISPITTPNQDRLNKTASEGQVNAQTLCSSLVAAWEYVEPLVLPDALHCWLDQEGGTKLSAAYWSGWANYVNGYNWANTDTYPLYACLYCNPCSGDPNCVSINDTCFGIWSYWPEPCGSSIGNTPTWNPKTCSGCGGYNDIPTIMWQYGEQNYCGYSANVDCDVAQSGYPNTTYSFEISSRP